MAGIYGVLMSTVLGYPDCGRRNQEGSGYIAAEILDIVEEWVNFK
jgi:hypothetical protein